MRHGGEAGSIMFRFAKLLTDHKQELERVQGGLDAPAGPASGPQELHGQGTGDGEQPASQPEEAAERIRRDLAIQMQRLHELLERVESGRLEEEAGLEALLTVSNHPLREDAELRAGQPAAASPAAACVKVPSPPATEEAAGTSAELQPEPACPQTPGEEPKHEIAPKDLPKPPPPPDATKSKPTDANDHAIDPPEQHSGQRLQPEANDAAGPDNRSPGRRLASAPEPAERTRADLPPKPMQREHAGAEPAGLVCEYEHEDRHEEPNLAKRPTTTSSLPRQGPDSSPIGPQPARTSSSGIALVVSAGVELAALQDHGGLVSCCAQEGVRSNTADASKRLTHRCEQVAEQSNASEPSAAEYAPLKRKPVEEPPPEPAVLDRPNFEQVEQEAATASQPWLEEPGRGPEQRCRVRLVQSEQEPAEPQQATVQQPEPSPVEPAEDWCQWKPWPEEQLQASASHVPLLPDCFEWCSQLVFETSEPEKACSGSEETAQELPPELYEPIVCLPAAAESYPNVPYPVDPPSSVDKSDAPGAEAAKDSGEQQLADDQPDCHAALELPAGSSAEQPTETHACEPQAPEAPKPDTNQSEEKEWAERELAESSETARMHERTCQLHLQYDRFEQQSECQSDTNGPVPEQLVEERTKTPPSALDQPAPPPEPAAPDRIAPSGPNRPQPPDISTPVSQPEMAFPAWPPIGSPPESASPSEAPAQDDLSSQELWMLNILALCGTVLTLAAILYVLADLAR